MADLEPTELTDEQIVSQVQSGRVELFGVLIVRYEKKMARYASKLLQNQDDIADVVQEIFTKVYINIQSFQTDRKFSSWLYRIAHNEIINVYKKNSKKRLLPLFDLDVFFPQSAKNTDNNVQRQVEHTEMKKVIDACFSQLPEKYKEPVALYYLEELSYKEIADIMRLPTATVGIRIKRAKELLKHIFEKQGYEYPK